MDLKFDWDDEKAAINLRKHGVAFERAAEVFRDGFNDSVPDEFSIGERRFKTTGVVRGIGLIVVVHAVENEGGDDEVIRIISARLANRRERKAYENG